MFLKVKKMKTLKKIVMAAAISLFAAGASNAQVYVSGSLSLSHSAGETEYKVGSKTETYDSNPVNSFTISPEIGFYVADGMSIGAEISYQFTKKKNASDKDYWTSDNLVKARVLVEVGLQVIHGCQLAHGLAYPCDHKMSQDPVRNPVESDAVINRVQYQLRCVHENRVDVGECTLRLLQFTVLHGITPKVDYLLASVGVNPLAGPHA